MDSWTDLDILDIHNDYKRRHHCLEISAHILELIGQVNNETGIHCVEWLHKHLELLSIDFIMLDFRSQSQSKRSALGHYEFHTKRS